ncbi:MAG TPA: hypothetical protein VN905_00725 [Candidatus Binatia bacterium]|nr:hypothetical protein [Candidatus Binatia bacterium]
MSDSQRLRALVATIGGFYIRDRSMSREQKKIERSLAGGAPSDGEARAYLAAARRYFSGFEREARAHLEQVDRELEKLYQVQYNLAAERGVAQRRVEATQGVLVSIEEIAAE